MANSLSKADDCHLQETLAELHLRAMNLRQSKIKSEEKFLEIPCEPKAREDLEKKRREILLQLETEGTQIERDFLEQYRMKLIGPLLNSGLSASDMWAATCGLGCTSCITPCTHCVTDCTVCVGPCPNCVACTSGVW